MARNPVSVWNRLLGLTIMATLHSSAYAQAPPLLGSFGSQGSGNGQFLAPTGIAVDQSGLVYVADQLSNRVEKFTNGGVFVTQWTCGPYAFPGASFIAADTHGDVYVTDPGNRSILKFTNTGIPITSWGLVGPGTRTGNPDVTQPTCVAVDVNDVVYVTDGPGNRIQKLTATGSLIAQWNSGPEFGIIDNPGPIAVDLDGSVYVGDTADHRIIKIDRAGHYIGECQGSPDAPFSLTSLVGLATDRLGHVFSTEASTENRIQEFTSDGVFIALWGCSCTGNDHFFYSPCGIATDSDGNVFVVDRGNKRVQKYGFRPTAAMHSTWGAVKMRFR